jgi:hypothetical protein
MSFKNSEITHRRPSIKCSTSDPLVSSLKNGQKHVGLLDDEHESRLDSILATPLITPKEAVDIETTIHNEILEDKLPPASYLQSNYEKAKKFFLQKNYFNFKLSLTNSQKQGNGKKTSVFDDLKYYLRDLLNHFQFLIENKPSATNQELTNEQKLYKLSANYLECLNKCIYLHDVLLLNAHKYDYDATCEANGYRSLGLILRKCCEGTLATMEQIYAQKSFFLFYMKYTLFTSELNDFEAWYYLIEKIEIILSIAAELQLLSAKNDFLFIKNEELPKKTHEMLLLLQSTYQEAFFGRTCCFQFCNSLRIPLITFTVAMATYNDSYDIIEQVNRFSQTARSLSTGTKYFMNPELRGKKIAHIMRTSNVAFCKFFSRLTDTPLFHVSPIIFNVFIVQFSYFI